MSRRPAGMYGGPSNLLGKERTKILQEEAEKRKTVYKKSTIKFLWMRGLHVLFFPERDAMMEKKLFVQLF